MSRLYIPEDYSPILDPTETQHAIKRMGGKLKSGLPHDGRAPEYSE